jgi:hypothetical protein
LADKQMCLTSRFVNISATVHPLHFIIETKSLMAIIDLTLHRYDLIIWYTPFECTWFHVFRVVYIHGQEHPISHRGCNCSFLHGFKSIVWKSPSVSTFADMENNGCSCRRTPSGCLTTSHVFLRSSLRWAFNHESFT